MECHQFHPLCCGIFQPDTLAVLLWHTMKNTKRCDTAWFYVQSSWQLHLELFQI